MEQVHDCAEKICVDSATDCLFGVGCVAAVRPPDGLARLLSGLLNWWREQGNVTWLSLLLAAWNLFYRERRTVSPTQMVGDDPLRFTRHQGGYIQFAD